MIRSGDWRAARAAHQAVRVRDKYKVENMIAESVASDTLHEAHLVACMLKYVINTVVFGTRRSRSTDMRIIKVTCEDAHVS